MHTLETILGRIWAEYALLCPCLELTPTCGISEEAEMYRRDQLEIHIDED